MEKVNVAFNGMSRVPDDAVARDGDMAVLVNMRLKDGELTRVSYPEKKNTMIQGGVKMAKWHGERLLELRADGALRVADTETYINNGYVVNTFEVMGNVVCMYTEDKALYSIYRDNGYVFLGELPEVPEMKMKLSHALKRFTSEEYYSYSVFDDKTAWVKNSKGFFDAVLDIIYKKKYFVDNALFIVGIKFFDGSYRYSHLYYVKGEGEFNLGGLTVKSGVSNFATYIGETNGDEKAKMTAAVVGFYTDLSFDYNLSKWEDVILSIDVFTSGSIMEHEVETEVVNLSRRGTPTTELVQDDVTVYTNKAIPQLRAELENCSVFYKFASYDLGGNLIWSAKETSLSYLSAQDKLPLTNTKQIVPNKHIVYNSRLHSYKYYELNNLATKNMLNGDYLEGKEEYEKKQIKMQTSVLFKNGALEKTLYDYTLGGISTDSLSCLISHPTRNISNTQSVYTESGVAKFISTELRNHYLMDMSLCLIGETERNYKVKYNIIGGFNNAYNSNDDAIYNIEFDPVVFLDKIGDKPAQNYTFIAPWDGGFNGGHWFWELYIEGEGSETFDVDEIAQYGVNANTAFFGARINISIEEIKCKYDITPIKETVNESILSGYENKEVINNVLRVSAVDNPFYFPTAQTYKFGGEIMGMASNAEAVSTGQFGQYPLFVFTTDGVWAMGVDTSGRGAYVSQAPFAREICNGGVCPVSGGVVFTTDAGVMAISGGQVVEISTALDGERPLMSDSSIYEHIFSRAGIPPVKPVRFRDYLKNARLGYDYLYKEVFLFNPDYAYSYVYSLESQSWYVRDVKLEYAVLGGKELIVYGDYWRYTFAEGVNSGPVVAITRPVKAGTNDYKRLRQAALRCTFKGHFSFYVLGSNDGADFVCITGKEYPSMNGNEPTDVMRRDLVTSMSRSKQYKYFAIAFAGNIEGRISMAELLVDMGFANNQIR